MHIKVCANAAASAGTLTGRFSMQVENNSRKSHLMCKNFLQLLSFKWVRNGKKSAMQQMARVKMTQHDIHLT